MVLKQTRVFVSSIVLFCSCSIQFWGRGRNPFLWKQSFWMQENTGLFSWLQLSCSSSRICPDFFSYLNQINNRILSVTSGSWLSRHLDSINTSCLILESKQRSCGFDSKTDKDAAANQIRSFLAFPKRRILTKLTQFGQLSQVVSWLWKNSVFPLSLCWTQANRGEFYDSRWLPDKLLWFVTQIHRRSFSK